VCERERELAQRRQRWGSEKRTFAWALAHSPVVFIVKMGEKEGKINLHFLGSLQFHGALDEATRGKKKKTDALTHSF